MYIFNRRIIILTLVLIFTIADTSLGQVTMGQRIRKITAQPDEYISMRGSLSFNDAIDEFSNLAKRHLNKIIVNPVLLDGNIGVDVNNLYWFEALEMVLTQNGLQYEEYGDHILITKPLNVSVDDKKLSAIRYFEAREVVISTVFFEANRNQLRELGMSWGIFDQREEVSLDPISGEPKLETVYRRGLDQSSANNKTGWLNFDFFDQLDFGDVTAIFKTLDNNQLGEVIASPQITVMSGKEGEIQIGSDFTVTVQDFAGNTVTQFFSTGSIITVTPQVITVDSVSFIHVALDAEKSSAVSSELGMEIKKSKAKTDLLLLDGEETIIGGLYSNDESETREGVPFLKDLPWWFFGLRYLFGYESVNTIQKELVILLKVDLVPSLADRIEKRVQLVEDGNKLKDNLENLIQERDNYLQQIEDQKAIPLIEDQEVVPEEE